MDEGGIVLIILVLLVQGSLMVLLIVLSVKELRKNYRAEIEELSKKYPDVFHPKTTYAFYIHGDLFGWGISNYKGFLLALKSNCRYQGPFGIISPTYSMHIDSEYHMVFFIPYEKDYDFSGIIKQQRNRVSTS